MHTYAQSKKRTPQDYIFIQEYGSSPPKSSPRKQRRVAKDESNVPGSGDNEETDARPLTPKLVRTSDNASSPTDTPLLTPSTECFPLTYTLASYPMRQPSCSYPQLPGVPIPQNYALPSVYLAVYDERTRQAYSQAYVYAGSYPYAYTTQYSQLDVGQETVTEFAFPVVLEDEDEIHRLINEFMFEQSMFPFGINVKRQQAEVGKWEAHTFLSIITPHSWTGLFETQIQQILSNAVDDDSVVISVRQQ